MTTFLTIKPQVYECLHLTTPADHLYQDFDILGTANTMQLSTFVPVTESYSWSDRTRNTMKVERKFIESEDEGKIDFTGNGATQVSFFAFE